MLVGCASSLSPLRSTWNSVNAGAADLEAQIASDHQADLDAVVQDDSLSTVAKLDKVREIEEKWHPAYNAYRSLRAALAVTRTAITAAEEAEIRGEPLDSDRIVKLTRSLLDAREAVKEAIP